MGEDGAPRCAPYESGPGATASVPVRTTAPGLRRVTHVSAIAVQVRSARVSPAQVPARRALDKRLWLAIGCIVTLVVVFQGRNMLHYPYLEADEGTYAS